MVSRIAFLCLLLSAGCVAGHRGHKAYRVDLSEGRGERHFLYEAVECHPRAMEPEVLARANPDLPERAASDMTFDEAARYSAARIELAHLSIGFLHARAVVDRLEIDADGRTGRARIRIERGARYRFDMVVPEVKGGETDGRTLYALNGLIGSREGEWFDRNAVARDIVALEKYFRARGYPAASVYPFTKVDDVSHRVFIRLEITLGLAKDPA